jgi:hypothetical protein
MDMPFERGYRDFWLVLRVEAATCQGCGFFIERHERDARAGVDNFR